MLRTISAAQRKWIQYASGVNVVHVRPLHVPDVTGAMQKNFLKKNFVLDENSLFKGAYRYLAWGIISFGLLPRLAEFTSGRALWNDESLVSAGIVERGFVGLLAPLDYMQIAPPFYLWSLKLCTLMGGYTVYAMRFPSVVMSIVGLVLGWCVVRRMLSPLGTLLALALLACSQHLITYAGEAKPYSGDAMFTLLVFYLALKWEECTPDWRRAGFFGVILAISVWMSYPVVFVIAGVGTVQLLRALIRRDKKDFFHLTGLYGISGASFLLQYLLVVLPNRTHGPMMEYMQWYWRHGFMPFPPTSLQDFRWFRIRTSLFFDMPGGFTLQGLALFTFLTGLCALCIRKRHHVAFLLAPLALVLFASGLRLYPFHARLTLFLVPVIMLAVGEGIAWITTTGRRRVGVAIGSTLIILLMTQPLVRASRTIIAPTRHHELEKAMDYTNAHWKPGDKVFLVQIDEFSYRFLSHRYRLPEEAFVYQSQKSKKAGTEETLLEDLARLVKKGGGVWFPITYQYEPDVAHIFAFLDNYGVRDHEFTARGASTCHYTFPVAVE